VLLTECYYIFIQQFFFDWQAVKLKNTLLGINLHFRKQTYTQTATIWIRLHTSNHETSRGWARTKIHLTYAKLTETQTSGTNFTKKNPPHSPGGSSVLGGSLRSLITASLFVWM